MRYDCDIAIWIDLRAGLVGGILFNEGNNEVILSPGDKGRSSPNYFLTARVRLRCQELPLKAGGNADEQQLQHGEQE